MSMYSKMPKFAHHLPDAVFQAAVSDVELSLGAPGLNCRSLRLLTAWSLAVARHCVSHRMANSRSVGSIHSVRTDACNHPPFLSCQAGMPQYLFGTRTYKNPVRNIIPVPCKSSRNLTHHLENRCSSGRASSRQDRGGDGRVASFPQQ